MGIRGLTAYVDTLPFGEGKVWESYNLRETNLVIDGCGLYYHIYNGLNIKFGGQYDQLQNKIKEFFSKLQLNNVVPYVVFDGIMARDEKKFATFMKRKTDRIKSMNNLWSSTLRQPGYEIMVLPRLTQSAIVQVLQEIKVPYAVADFEADCEIASLANKLDAPVMANDSDFYIFNIRRGYIPFQQYNFFGPNSTVRKFSFDGFAKHLGIDPSMSPLLASLAGNDYITYTMLKPFTTHIESLVSSSKLEAHGSRKCKVPTIAQFLSGYKSVSEAIDAVIGLFPNNLKVSFKKALDLSIEEYQMKQSNLIGYFDSYSDLSCNMRTYNGHLLPQWVVKLYREDLIASEGLACLCNRKIFLRTQCEDVSLPSAQTCAQGLRWYYYALALNCELDTNTVVPATELLQSQNNTAQATTADIVVTELDREGLELVPKKVNLTRKVPEIDFQIHDIPKMSDEAKNSHLLSLLDSDLSFIHDLPIKHQIVVSALRYWVIHSHIKPAHLAALLVYYVGEKQSSTTSESFQISLEAVHGFSQWQNVLYWVERLNTLFSSTFPQLQVAKLYDGVQVCLVYERLQVSGIKYAESIVTNTNLYHHLYDVITRGLPHDCQFNQSRSSETQQNKGGRTLEQETKSKISEVLKGNMFAFVVAFAMMVFVCAWYMKDFKF